MSTAPLSPIINLLQYAYGHSRSGRRLLVGLTLLAGPIACQSSTQQPSAVRDLLIDRISWQPTPGDSANQHQFSITNTSPRYSYQQIKLCFAYYTKDYRLLGSDTSVVDTIIRPGTIVKQIPMRLGALRPGTNRTEIRVLTAAADS
ncbi:hypothetical protein [Spirosoma rhododendri]|uniref:Uncharacterized protein n=1 Tax=Spirosoma rhododendri TaxID=2728024 RepID=A0A7L5DTN0_9BACT|nr:hypothetical protein [Spirosoma rhododendri]QJD79958.1 hypothetical protein HH216_17225 [Spirosoma rhododendri]